MKDSDLIRSSSIAENRRFIGIIIGIFVLAIAIGIINSKWTYYKGMPMDSTVSVDYAVEYLANPNMPQISEDNYVRYLAKAYILIGEYPDCEYFKISANVAKNDYNWNEDFHTKDGGKYWYRFKDGKPVGKIAIDVSEFQKKIKWKKVKKAGVDIAIIRVGFRGYGSEGKLLEDEFAKKNLDGAEKAGLETGVYFFSSAINKDEGIEEAKFVLDILKGRKLKQPVIIDTEYVAEYEEARANSISVEDRTDAVVAFCETIEAAGYTPMIYASRDQFVKYLDIERIGKWEFWLAAYDPPIFPYHTEAYQYTPGGQVDGIETDVDLDVWMR
ncbi:MAG: Lyzozyme M1 (1,4-beta-N-acetylmuramidase) [Eubacterium sp.]|nr:Lyzozyme M1 (1,4-beta-N-acetylmuramidase) [Eubacterium sp.]